MEEKEYQVERCQRKEAVFGHFALSVWSVLVFSFVLGFNLRVVTSKSEILGSLEGHNWKMALHCILFQFPNVPDKWFNHYNKIHVLLLLTVKHPKGNG